MRDDYEVTLFSCPQCGGVIRSTDMRLLIFALTAALPSSMEASDLDDFLVSSIVPVKFPQ